MSLYRNKFGKKVKLCVECKSWSPFFKTDDPDSGVEWCNNDKDFCQKNNKAHWVKNDEKDFIKEEEMEV